MGNSLNFIKERVSNKENSEYYNRDFSNAIELDLPLFIPSFTKGKNVINKVGDNIYVNLKYNPDYEGFKYMVGEAIFRNSEMETDATFSTLKRCLEKITKCKTFDKVVGVPSQNDLETCIANFSYIFGNPVYNCEEGEFKVGNFTYTSRDTFLIPVEYSYYLIPKK